ncbi:MAG: branched-chain amino acid transaminase [Gammaproteobacteria bacterium]|nr:MAG: branched-chain amino acid transaminase [Gammaproteobacteria bacterium]
MTSFADRDGFIWLDGEFVDWRAAKIHVLTHSLHYGMAVFEGIRAYRTDQGRTAVFRLQEHTERLFRSAHIMRMPINFSQDVINGACREAVAKNGLASAYIRPICFYGSEGMGVRADNLRTHVAIAVWEWGAYLGKDGMEKGIQIRTSSYTRHHVNTSMCKAKATGHYINSMLALREAVECGMDEALLLDHQGFVAEGSGENFFLVRNNIIYTPDLSSALDGITRDSVIILAREAGYEVREKRITRDEVYIADEAFFTGTAAEVTPIRALDGRTIGNGGRGPVTRRLQDLFFDQVHGRGSQHPDWLAYIDE